MQRFRNKPITPVTIDAVQWSGDPKDIGVIKDFASQNQKIESVTTPKQKKGGPIDRYAVIKIKQKGSVLLSPGDWIISDVKGEITTCKPDIFEKTYELI